MRTALAREFVPTLDRRHCRYMWLGTDLVFDAFKFFIAETEHGVVQAHAYPYDERMSTFIVEMHERTWKRLGLGELSPSERQRGRGLLSCSPKRSTATACSRTTRGGSTS